MAKTRGVRKPKTTLAQTIALANILPQPLSFETIYEDREYDSMRARRLAEKRAARGDGVPDMQSVPVRRRVPVLLINHPEIFQQEHRFVLRQVLEDICKEHRAGSELYFEVGRSDDLIEGTIAFCIKFLDGYGVQAERAEREVPYTNPADPRANW